MEVQHRPPKSNNPVLCGMVYADNTRLMMSRDMSQDKSPDVAESRPSRSGLAGMAGMEVSGLGFRGGGEFPGSMSESLSKPVETHATEMLCATIRLGSAFSTAYASAMITLSRRRCRTQRAVGNQIRDYVRRGCMFFLGRVDNRVVDKEIRVRESRVYILHTISIAEKRSGKERLTMELKASLTNSSPCSVSKSAITYIKSGIYCVSSGPKPKYQSDLHLTH
jgi:hypothetical protein